MSKAIVQFRHPVQSGFSLFEIIIGVSIIMVALLGLTEGYSIYLKAGFKNGDAFKASILLEEGAEAATLMRDNSWSSFSALSTSTAYFLNWNGSMWQATTSVQLVDGAFRRTVSFGDVFRRNSDKDIVATSSPDAKSFDPNTKMITIRVTGPKNLDKKLVTYLANLFE